MQQRSRHMIHFSRWFLPSLFFLQLFSFGCADYRTIRAYKGSTPQIDGKLLFDEWTDATHFNGVQQWTATFSPVTDAADLSVDAWIKHDRDRIYLALNVTDDVLYGFDIAPWLPPENPFANNLTQQGWPWFGDEAEFLIDATRSWSAANETAAGNGTSSQMVVNLHKSRLHGIGVGGLLEGEPRTSDAAWSTYQHWIYSGAQQAAALPHPSGHGYVIEWSIAFDPCVELAPGEFYSGDMPDTLIGFNLAVGDLDLESSGCPQNGTANFGCIHHEMWVNGTAWGRTYLSEYADLWLMHDSKP
eukprot:TRINITY_DN20084_c0_g1_i1.p1 TRINITY_DN20084_c0_g1~~TRINITY_DN20084_c0_g1_i1.p1  ORF type:complete len:301 (+),score=89.72 TRINITY_DN20084_c0_g1_i1:140-1042(+)